MRKGPLRFVVVCAVGVAVVLAAVGVAAAVGSITTPGANPFVVPADGGMIPQSFTIAASGFATGANVKAEICDGLPASDELWLLNQDCDLGTQTAGQSSPGVGSTLTFTAGDANFGMKPFRGASPQSLFTCYSPGQWSSANNGTIDGVTGLPAWNNCQIRIASAIADQTFATMILPDPLGLTTTTSSTTTTTTSITVPGAPTIGVASPHNLSVSVAFSPPASNGGSSITGYTATCTSSNGGTTRSANGGASPIVVVSLTLTKTYTCKVKATNIAGPGPLSSASNAFVVATAPSAPSAVKVASGTTRVATGSLTVRFIAGRANGAAITKFTARCVSTNGGAARGGVHNGATAAPIVVAAVTTKRTYRCTVTATNAKGTSAASPASAVVIMGAPGQPGKPGVARTAAGRIRVSFANPANNGAAITGVSASCSSSNGGAARAKSGAAGPLVVTALTPGKTYTCTVRAANARGAGPASIPSNSVKA